MKFSVLKSVAFALLGVGFLAVNAVATPIYFDIAGGGDTDGSSVGFTRYTEGLTIGPWTFADGSTLEVILAEGLDDVNFTLEEGEESAAFDFLTFNATGTGIGFFELEATMAFDAPDVADATSTAEGLWSSVDLGWASYQTGALMWADNTIDLTDSWGNNLTVTLEQGLTFVAGGTTNLQATITNYGGGIAPVPEPATMLLFGTGLVGLAAASRKRKK